MGRNSATFNKIYIVVIDFEQKAILNYLLLQLEGYLEKENIEIHGATSIFEYNKLMETLPAIDLLVTTSKFEKIVEHNEHVIVSNDFNMIDKLKVSDNISLIKEKHNKDKFFSICDYVFKKDLFYSNVDIDNKNDLIKYCCDILEKKDIVDKRFIDSVYKREEFLSTEIDTGIALPHGLNYFAKTTKMLVVILKKPILWNCNKIQVVFMGCIDYDHAYIFNYLMEYLSKLILNDQFKKNIINCKTYDEFKELIASLQFNIKL